MKDFNLNKSPFLARQEFRILFDSSCEEAVTASLLESKNRKRKIKRLLKEFQKNVSLGYICL